MPVRFRVLVVSIALTLCASTSHAVSLVQWTFEGEVNSVFDAGPVLGGAIVSNDSVSGDITLDLDQLDADPGDPDVGRYTGSAFSVTMGDLSFEAASMSVRVTNATIDGVEVGGFVDLVAGGDATLEAMTWQFKLELIQPPPALGLSDDSLPAIPPDPSVFNVGTSFMVGNGGFVNVTWTPTETDAERVQAAVPEPGSALLFVIAMGAARLGVRRRR